MTRADVVAKASVRSSKVSIRRGNLGWQGHEPQMRRARSSSVLAGRRLGSFGKRRGLRFAASSAALGSGCPRGGSPGRVRTHMSSFITTSMELLSPTVAWRLGIPKKLEHARPGCSARLGSIRSAPGASPTSSLAARTAGSTRQPRRALGGRPWLKRSTAFARCRPGSRTAERDATRGWRVSGQHA